MANNRKPLIIRNKNILGAYQIIGGLWGLSLMVIYFLNSFDQSLISIIFSFVGAIFFGFSLYCGILCVKKEKNALALSRINQCLQLLAFSGQNLGFLYVAGFGVFFGLDIENGLGFSFNYNTSTLLLSFSEQSENKKIVINLIALYLLFNFNMLLKEQKEANVPTLEL